MEAIEEIHANANAEMIKLTESVDRKVRPLQRLYFSCCYNCSSDERPAAEVGPCVASCVSPLTLVQDALSEAQEKFQSRTKRCHEIAGESIPASERREVSAASMALYVAKLRPCVEEETRKLPELLRPIHTLIPKAISELEKVTPKNGGLGGERKGWF